MKTFNYLLLALLVLQTLALMGQPETITNALTNPTQTLGIDKVFIKTDKDIYAPGETIEFKAQVLNAFTGKPSDESELVLMLKAEFGEIIIDNKFPIQNGVITSNLVIPNWCSEGKFFLIAYTQSAVKSNDAYLAAIQPITINQLKKNDYVLSAKVDKEIYRPMDEVKLTLELKPITPSARKERVTVSLYDLHEEISTLRRNFVVDIPNEISIKLPEKINDGFYIDIQSDKQSNFSKKIPIRTTKDQINVEFYPEGGTLLSNNNQRIVYRASNIFGEPVDVSGQVFDETGHQVGIAKIMKKGFGLVTLVPNANQQYILKIDSEYGKGQSFAMPKAVVNGSSFSLVRTENNTLRTSLTNIGSIVGKQLTICAFLGNNMVSKIDFEAKPRQIFEFKTNDLPIGIINFVVTDQSSEILSERLIYNIPNIEPDPIAIETRKNPSTGDFNLNIDLNNIVTSYGISGIADVKVVDRFSLEEEREQAQFNFLKYPLIEPTPRTVLDNYLANIELIANKNRFASLEEVINGTTTTNSSTNSISGLVINNKGKPVPNAIIMAIAHNQPFSSSATTDEKGRFTLSGAIKTDDVILKATTQNGRKLYKVLLDKTFDETLDKILLCELFKWPEKSDVQQWVSYFERNKNQLTITSIENKMPTPKGVSTTERMLMSGNSVLDVIAMLKPFTIKDNQIVFYGGINSLLYQQGALIVVDGQKMGTSISALEAVNPYDIATINVSTNLVDIQQYTALNAVGIIEITTKMGENKNHTQPKDIKPENIESTEWERQTTLLWQPNLSPNADGQIKLTVKPSKIQSEFVVVVEFTSTNGVRFRAIKPLN